MALRSPVYLDVDTLLALAQYHHIDVPIPMDVVERSSRSRELGAGTSSAVAIKATSGKNVEYQSSYSLTPQQKAVVSQAIDGLHEARLLKPADEALGKDALVEVSGEAVMTACSIVAKALFVVRDGLKGVTDMDSIAALDNVPPDVWQSAKEVYIDNRPAPIPLLLELQHAQTSTPTPTRRWSRPRPPSQFTGRVFISLEPSFFVDVAAIERVKGAKTILARVSVVVPDEEFRQTDEWLLSGWEWMTRRVLMTKMGDLIGTLIEKLEIPVDDRSIRDYIPGPAVVVDAVAMY